MDQIQYEKMVEGINLLHNDLSKMNKSLSNISGILTFFAIITILGFILTACFG